MTELKITDGKIVNPESDRLEFKSCRNKLSKDFWPTYSAFGNTFGGTVIIGVDDETRTLIGVNDPDKIIKELWDLVNDGKKVNVNLLSTDDVRVMNFDGKQIIKIHIPRAERRKRPVFINGSMENGTYKRNGESDYHCSIDELQQMLRDASEISHDSEVIDRMSIDDLDIRSLTSFRERMASRNPSHPWNDKSNEEFLRLIGACSKGQDDHTHPTLAGLLMFGFDYSIMSVVPNYHLDYLEFADRVDNWTFRITTGSGEFTGNIYNFMIEVSNRIIMANERGKEIAGMSRVDDTGLIRAQRELVLNALVHADYEGLRGVRIEKRDNTFSVRNPGNLRIPLKDMFDGGISDPRNPRIALMLGLIGLVERAGSGVSDVLSSCRKMNIPDPVYTETVDPETVTVLLRTRIVNDENSIETIIIETMRKNPSVSIDTISEQTGLERNKVARIINKMKKSGLVERIGGTRGHWMV